MNKERAIALVTRDGEELRNLSGEFRNDKDVVMAAIDENIAAFQYAPDALRDDKDVVMRAVRFQLLNDTFTSRKEVTRMHHRIPARIHMEYISDRLKGDKDVMMQAVRINGVYLRHATIRDDELVIEAIKTYGGALEFASDRLKNDKAVVLAAVQDDGYALGFASPELKRDREIVMTAVTRNPQCIQLADPLFKDDLDMIMTALARSDVISIPDIYAFASPRCQMDIEVLAFMYDRRGPRILDRVPEEIWTNPKVLDWASHLPERDIPARFRDKVNTYKDAISHAQPRATNRLTALPDSLVGKISSYLGGKSRKRKRNKNKTKKR
jgi:hypothetical protein